MNMNLPLSDVGYKIFLDRYAQKDPKKETLAPSDMVVVCVNPKESHQREVGIFLRRKERQKDGERVEVGVVSIAGEEYEVPMDYIDKPIEVWPEQVMGRVASAIAGGHSNADYWTERFLHLLDEWRFVPAGRILTQAGTGQTLSLYNCYVIPSPKDSREGIMESVGKMIEIMSRGGGVGVTLSSLRPRFGYVKGVNGRSSGAVSWAGLYSHATGLIEQGGSRRGALMVILNVWHPDIEEFIEAKKKKGVIENANVSVAICDGFMDAVKNDLDWDLVFPDTEHENYDEEWDGNLELWKEKGYPYKVYKTIRARKLWELIVGSAWESAEPGLWFQERTNKMSNSHYYARLVSCNPCAEEPLPGYGVCNLGSLNLPKFLKKTDSGYVVDWILLRECIGSAVRFLDNICDEHIYFIEENKEIQLGERRIGLGTMGIAQMMLRMEIRYGSDESLEFIDNLYEFIASEAYLASVEIAKEKGAFPFFNADKYLNSGFMKAMPQRVRDAVRAHGIRNVTVLTQPPCGTTGTMIGTSTGIEPFFFWEYERTSRLGKHIERVPEYQEFIAEGGDPDNLPDHFVTAMDLSPKDHVRVQAAIQRWVDSAISKTCNLPSDYTVKDTMEIYELMYDLGCKGGTVYRDGSRHEQILHAKSDHAEDNHGLECQGEPGQCKIAYSDGCATCVSCGASKCSI